MRIASIQRHNIPQPWPNSQGFRAELSENSNSLATEKNRLFIVFCAAKFACWLTALSLETLVQFID